MKSLPSLLLIGLLFHGSAAGQSKEPTRSFGRAQAFYFDAMNFATYDDYGLSGRLDVFVQVPFDIVTFIRKEETFVANYTITANVTNEEGQKLASQSWDRQIRRLAFESTVNPLSYDLTQNTFTLAAGPVILEVVVEDRESSREYRSSRKVDIRRFDQNLFALSDMLLIRNVEVLQNKKHLTPQIDPNVGSLSDGFHLFFEVYNPFELQTCSLHMLVSRKGVTALERWETQQLQKGSNSFITEIKLDALNLGAYIVELSLFRVNDTTSTGLLGKGTKAFTIEWMQSGTPISITDIDLAIEQLQYFAQQKDLDYIKEPKEQEERRKRFEEFWERHNPAPGASPNRALVEYYNRIAYANEHFSHYIPGWKTDRGMVYVIYGKPSYVDRQVLDFERGSNEIWEYYDVNKRFTFIDETGFGDYRLLYPIWDERNRLR